MPQGLGIAVEKLEGVQGEVFCYFSFNTMAVDASQVTHVREGGGDLQGDKHLRVWCSGKVSVTHHGDPLVTSHVLVERIGGKRCDYFYFNASVTCFADSMHVE